MRRILFAFSILFFSVFIANSQTPGDSITLKKVNGGYQYLQDGKPLTLPQLDSLFQNNAEALKNFKSAKSTNVFLYILSYTGGYLIGYPLGQAIGGKDPLWEMAAVGAGLIAIAIPIANGVTKKLNKAVELYNNGLSPTSFWDDKELKLQMTGNGIGLALKF